MTKGIYFKEDIIDELAEETGISKKELTEIINLNIGYIKKTVIEKPVLLISLPNLAKLRFNLKLGMSSRYANADNNSALGIRKNESLDKKIELLSSYFQPQLVSFNQPLFLRLYKKIVRKSKITQIYQKMYKLWAEVERKSNEILKNIK